MIYCAAEYDGEGHDPSRDALRSEQLKMPVARFSAEEIWRPGFVGLFWDRIYQKLGL